MHRFSADSAAADRDEIGVRVDKAGLKPRARKSYVAPKEDRGRQ